MVVARVTGEIAELSTQAKLVRVVLSERGPLCPREVAEEAHTSVDTARTALEELADTGVAEPVCGMAATREEVYGLADDHAE